MLGQFDRDNTQSFTHHVGSVGDEIGQRFLRSIRPQHFSLIDTLVIAQPEVDAAKDNFHHSALRQAAPDLLRWLVCEHSEPAGYTLRLPVES